MKVAIIIEMLERVRMRRNGLERIAEKGDWVILTEQAAFALIQRANVKVIGRHEFDHASQSHGLPMTGIYWEQLSTGKIVGPSTVEYIDADSCGVVRMVVSYQGETICIRASALRTRHQFMQQSVGSDQ